MLGRDPSASLPAHTHLQEHPMESGLFKSCSSATKVVCICFDKLTCLVEVSVGQQHRTEGLRTLVVWGPVFVGVSILPPGPVSLSCSVSIPRGATELIRRKSASRSPAHPGNINQCLKQNNSGVWHYLVKKNTNSKCNSYKKMKQEINI